VELEFAPRPPPDEEEALRQALGQALVEGAPAVSEWWREGIREGLLTEGPGEPPDAIP
jgi:hypothetical protein